MKKKKSYVSASFTFNNSIIELCCTRYIWQHISSYFYLISYLLLSFPVVPTITFARSEVHSDSSAHLYFVIDDPCGIVNGASYTEDGSPIGASPLTSTFDPAGPYAMVSPLEDCGAYKFIAKVEWTDDSTYPFSPTVESLSSQFEVLALDNGK